VPCRHAGVTQEYRYYEEAAVADLVEGVAGVVGLSDTRGKTMSERIPAAIAAVSAIVIVAYACATAPATNPSPAPNAQQPADQRMPGGPPGGPGGQRVPLTDSARRVRDSLNSARRDSASAMILRSIAGRENQPAESVFKNIKILKGFPAGRLVAIMNMGFGRSLGVSCGFCHVPGKWDLDDKEEKNTARLMFAMVQTINRDYMAKVPNDRGAPPVVNCFTCHRGNSRPMGQDGPPPGTRPPPAPPASGSD
jgi:hypothetical protein